MKRGLSRVERGRGGFGRVALFGLAAAVLAGAWLALAPAPALGHGANSLGSYDPQIRPSGETGNPCTTSRSYTASGGSNTADLRVTTNNGRCNRAANQISSGSWFWRRYEVKVASVTNVGGGSGSTIPGAHIEYVSGLAAGTGSWRSAPGATYGFRATWGGDSGHIGRTGGNLNDLGIRFSVPETHVGNAYLVFTILASGGHEHAEAVYADPHVAALPLLAPLDAGGTPVSGNLAATSPSYAASGGAQRLRVFLRNAYHGHAYNAAHVNVARSVFSNATIKITSDAAGQNAISGAKIGNSSALDTAIGACTETAVGDTCTIPSASFPQATGMNPLTTHQDIWFSVPDSHAGPAYVFALLDHTGKSNRRYALKFEEPVPIDVHPLAVPQDSNGDLSTASLGVGRPRPAGGATQRARLFLRDAAHGNAYDAADANAAAADFDSATIRISSDGAGTSAISGATISQSDGTSALSACTETSAGPACAVPSADWPATGGTTDPLDIWFQAPASHTGAIYLTLKVEKAGTIPRVFSFGWGDPIAVHPLAVPQDSAGVLESGDLSAATRNWLPSAAALRARVFLRNAARSGYDAAHANVARSAFDNAAIKITSDADGQIPISGAKIGNSSALDTAIGACTETSVGDTCTIPSASFPQGAGGTPLTTQQDIWFSVPDDHAGPAYVAVTASKAGEVARTFTAKWDPPAQIGVHPLAVPQDSAGTPVAWDVADAQRFSSRTAARQRARVLLHTAPRTGYDPDSAIAAPADIDSVVIRVASDTGGANAIANAAISDSSGSALSACTETSAGPTCTITRANWPAASGATRPFDIWFSVPGDHGAAAYLTVTAAHSDHRPRTSALKYDFHEVTDGAFILHNELDDSTACPPTIDETRAIDAGTYRRNGATTVTVAPRRTLPSAADCTAAAVNHFRAVSNTGNMFGQRATSSWKISLASAPLDGAPISGAHISLPASFSGQRPDASGLNPRTRSLDGGNRWPNEPTQQVGHGCCTTVRTYRPVQISFTVPSSHVGPVYLHLNVIGSRLFTLNPASPERPSWTTFKFEAELQAAAGGNVPQVRTTTPDQAPDGGDPSSGVTAVRGRPVGIATQVQTRGGAAIRFASLDSAAALRLTAEDGTIVHEQLCPRTAPEHPLDAMRDLATATSCTITGAALMAFQQASATDAVRGLGFAYIADAGSAASGSVQIVWRVDGADYEENLAFTHAAPPDPDALAASAFLDWADKGTDYATAGPTAMFTVGRSGTEVDKQAMPGGLAWARFNELEASGTAVRLSIDRGEISYNGAACTENGDGDCQITLTLAELMAERSAMATDLVGNLRVGYSLPVGTAATLTVEAWAVGATEPVSGTLELGAPGASDPVATVTLPGDPDRMIAPGQTAEIAAGFRVAVAESGAGWGCAGFGPSFLELKGPHDLVEGCLLTRSTDDPPLEPSPTTEPWLADDSYLVINGPATFEDGGGKRLSLGGTWSNLRCGLATAQGAAGAGERDIACWVTNAAGGRPQIIVDADADEDLTITANLVVPDERTLRLFTGSNPDLDGNPRLDRFAEAAAFDLPGAIFGSGTIQVGAVKELDRISLTRAAVNGVVPTGTIPAGATRQKLLLGILNENGVASRLSDVSSITVFTTGGGNLSGYGCTNAISCSISLKRGDELAMKAADMPSVVAAIELTLNAPDKPGTANVQATVVGTDGTSFEETLALVISGPAATLSSGGGVPRVHSMMTANDDRDVIKIPVSASDAGGNAAPMPANAAATVRTAAGATLPSGSHSAEVECEGTTRYNCNVVVAVLASAANPLASGAYTATVSGSGIAETMLRFTVAGPTETIALEIPEELGGLAESFPATARAEDKDGIAVADGTWVVFSATATQGGGTPTVIVSSPVPSDHDDDPDTPRVRRAQTKDGAADASATIVGRGVAVLTATADGKSDSLPVDTRVEAGEAAPSVEAASPGAASYRLAIYRGRAITGAAAVLALGPEGSTVVWLWNGKRWLRYSETEGEAPPGSEDFIVLPGDVLWFSGA